MSLEEITNPRAYISRSEAASLLSPHHTPECAERGFFIPIHREGDWWQVGHVIPHGFYVERMETPW